MECHFACPSIHGPPAIQWTCKLLTMQRQNLRRSEMLLLMRAWEQGQGTSGHWLCLTAHAEPVCDEQGILVTFISRPAVACMRRAGWSTVVPAFSLSQDIGPALPCRSRISDADSTAASLLTMLSNRAVRKLGQPFLEPLPRCTRSLRPKYEFLWDVMFIGNLLCASGEAEWMPRGALPLAPGPSLAAAIHCTSEPVLCCQRLNCIQHGLATNGMLSREGHSYVMAAMRRFHPSANRWPYLICLLTRAPSVSKWEMQETSLAHISSLECSHSGAGKGLEGLPCSDTYTSLQLIFPMWLNDEWLLLLEMYAAQHGVNACSHVLSRWSHAVQACDAQAWAFNLASMVQQGYF